MAHINVIRKTATMIRKATEAWGKRPWDWRSNTAEEERDSMQLASVLRQSRTEMTDHLRPRWG